MFFVSYFDELKVESYLCISEPRMRVLLSAKPAMMFASRLSRSLLATSRSSQRGVDFGVHFQVLLSQYHRARSMRMGFKQHLRKPLRR